MLLQIVNLVSSRPRVSKLEFFVALALVALAQSGKGEPFLIYFISSSSDIPGLGDVSIEQVAALSSQNTLPEPTLDLSNLQPSSSILPSTAAASRKNTPSTIHAPVPAYSSDDPWNTNPRFTNVPGPAAFGDVVAPPLNGATSTLGTGLPTEWWKNRRTLKLCYSVNKVSFSIDIQFMKLLQTCVLRCLQFFCQLYGYYAAERSLCNA
jgi:sorting nexin-8